MIPAIGVMIGCYIVTRCTSMICDKNEAVIVKVLGVGTWILTALCLAILILSGK